jgi:hypothetical protein
MSEFKLTISILLVSSALICSMPVGSRGKTVSPNQVSARDSKTAAAGSGHTVVGTASWYGPGLQGRRTAIGERFNSRKMTAAASPQLPIGSRAVVTNLKNGRSVQVHVNDCEPGINHRKIDLSKQAARRLGMIHDGPRRLKSGSWPHPRTRGIAITRPRDDPSTFVNSLSIYLRSRDSNSCNRSIFNGLVRYSSNPAERACRLSVSCPYPVSAASVILCDLGSLRIRRATS